MSYELLESGNVKIGEKAPDFKWKRKNRRKSTRF